MKALPSFLLWAEHLPALLGKVQPFETKIQKVSVCFAERWGRLEKSLQALFIFQESRMVVKYCEFHSLFIITF